MSVISKELEIEKKSSHQWSSNLFEDQKRKISQILQINELKSNNNGNIDNNLVIPSKDRSKHRLSGKSNKTTDDSQQDVKSTSKFELVSYKNKDLNLTLDDFESWDYSTFDYEIIESEDVPIISSPFWPFEELEGYNKEKGVDLRNIVLKSACQFNMANCGLEFDMNVTLKGESSIWIFSRSDPKVEFDKFTSIIKISKEDKSQKCFFTLGTFVYDIRGNKILKTFLRHQLINYNKNKSTKHIEEDFCDFRICIVDAGEEKIIARITFNDSKIENNIQGDFFLPMFDYSKVMIAGSGQACILRKFQVKAFHKIGTHISGESRNCECCRIF